ncbi:MAG: HYR domain-containing protein [Candidatus Pacebacteria bacterium]|nr:HYR domain-containing protein [Candidatus Paceibacterota bacterium]
MNKAIAGLFISLGFLVPVLVSAHSSNKPPKDKVPPSLSYIHIESDNADSSRATAGDTVTLTFEASEKVTPIVLIETKTLFVRANNTSGNSWSASYVVNSKDRTGEVDYLLLVTDTAKNSYICSSARLPFIKYCPTTDGSSVTIYKDTTPPPPTDTEAPVIEASADVHATTEGTTATVSYTTPYATDNTDGSVAVSCTPASGSEFGLGTTTVTCSAEDAAGNEATSTFLVVVEQDEVESPYEPSPYTMGTQPDESFLCGEDTNSWRYCDETLTTSFTGGLESGIATIDLGAGSSMGTGTIQTVTIAGEMDLFFPWEITISCFTDPAHTSPCGDWSTITDEANETSDGKYWDADFSALNRTFNQGDYYVMTINDQGQEAAVYGSESLLEPYWLIIGLR